MMRARWILLASILLGGTSACSKSLMFYETGKLSLTIEGRPDSSEPVQGNLGFKQRTAVVAPAMHTAQGDPTNSASMISSFLIYKDSGWGPLHIRTGFVTGKAARSLSPSKAEQVAQAVSGIGVPTRSDNATLAIQNATEADEQTFKTLTAKSYDALTADERTTLGRLTGAGSLYDAQLHGDIQKALKGG
jgi:hypothetical protein